MVFSTFFNFSTHLHKERYKTKGFFTFYNFSLHLHKERYKTNAFFTFPNFCLHLHKERCKTNGCFNLFERKHSKTNGFLTCFSENTVKPMVF